MKVACDKCGASYNILDERIPEEGMTMKCPKCLVSFKVKKDEKIPPGLEKSRTILGIGLKDKDGLLGSLSKLKVSKGDGVPSETPSMGAIVTPPGKNVSDKGASHGPTTLPGVGTERKPWSKEDEFFVKRHTGRVFGPFPVDAIANMLADGKLEGNEEISEDKTSWKPLASHPHLKKASSPAVDNASAPELPALRKKESSQPELPALRKKESSQPELPALKKKEASSPKLPKIRSREVSEPGLPAAKPREVSEPGLPAAKSREASAPDLPTAKSREVSEPELPTAKSREVSAPDLPVPKTAEETSSGGPPPIPGGRDLGLDLPTPREVGGSEDRAENLPVAKPGEDLGLDVSDLDLVEPKKQQVRGQETGWDTGARELDFSAEPRDRESSEDSSLSLDLGATPIDLDELDVVLPASDETPKREPTGSSAIRTDVVSAAPSKTRGAFFASLSEKLEVFKEKKILLAAIGGVCLLLVVVVVLWKVLGSKPEETVRERKPVERDVKVADDLKIPDLKELREDTVSGYEKALNRARKTFTKEKENPVAAASWAKAAYSLALRYDIKKKDYKKARSALARAVKSGEKHDEITKAAALRDIYNKKSKRASKVLESLCRKNNDAEGCVFWGWAELERGRVNAAGRAFRKALKIEKDFPAAAYGKALAYLRAGRISDGISWLKKTKKGSPDHLEARLVKILIDLRNRRTGTFVEKDRKELADLIGEKVKEAEASGSRKLDQLAGAVWGLFLELSGKTDEAFAVFDKKTKKSTDPLVVSEYGWALYRSGRYGECIKRVQAAKRKARRDVYLIRIEAECLMAEGKNDQAEAVVRKVFKRHKNEPILRVLRGRINQARGKDEAAEKYYKLALEIDPRHVPAYDAWIRFKTRSINEIPGAYAQIEQLEVQGIKDPSLTVLRGDLYAKQQRWEEAVAEYRKALEERPFENEYKTSLGSVYLSAGKLDEGKEILQQVWDTAKSGKSIAIEMARYHDLSNNRVEAIKILEEGVKIRPTIKVKLTLAEHRLKTGDEEKTKKALEFLLKLAEERRMDYRVNRMAGKAYLQSGNYNEAEVYLKRSLAIKAGDVETRLLMARAYMGGGDVNRAVAELKEALAVDPDAVDVLEYRARIAFSRGAVLSAMEDLDRILKIKPSASVHTLRAECLLERRDSKNARRALENALELDPRYPRAHYILGREYYRAGQIKAAVQSLRQAVVVLEERGAEWLADAHYMLGNAFLQLRDNRQAKRHLESFLDLTKGDKAMQTRRQETERNLRRIAD